MSISPNKKPSSPFPGASSPGEGLSEIDSARRDKLMRLNKIVLNQASPFKDKHIEKYLRYEHSCFQIIRIMRGAIKREFYASFEKIRFQVTHDPQTQKKMVKVINKWKEHTERKIHQHLLLWRDITKRHQLALNTFRNFISIISLKRNLALEKAFLKLQLVSIVSAAQQKKIPGRGLNRKQNIAMAKGIALVLGNLVKVKRNENLYRAFKTLKNNWENARKLELKKVGVRSEREDDVLEGEIVSRQKSDGNGNQIGERKIGTIKKIKNNQNSVEEKKDEGTKHHDGARRDEEISNKNKALAENGRNDSFERLETDPDKTKLEISMINRENETLREQIQRRGHRKSKSRQFESELTTKGKSRRSRKNKIGSDSFEGLESSMDCCVAVDTINKIFLKRLAEAFKAIGIRSAKLKKYTDIASLILFIERNDAMLRLGKLRALSYGFRKLDHTEIRLKSAKRGSKTASLEAAKGLSGGLKNSLQEESGKDLWRSNGVLNERQYIKASQKLGNIRMNCDKNNLLWAFQ